MPLDIAPGDRSARGAVATPRGAALAFLLILALLGWLPARAGPPAEVGPEDVPADNRFDTGRMVSSLVVPDRKSVV